MASSANFILKKHSKRSAKKSFEHIPKCSENPRNVQQGSERFQNVPKNSGTFLMVPRSSGRMKSKTVGDLKIVNGVKNQINLEMIRPDSYIFQHKFRTTPKRFETVRRGLKSSEGFREVPRCSENRQRAQRTSDMLQGIRRNSEIVPKRCGDPQKPLTKHENTHTRRRSRAGFLMLKPPLLKKWFSKCMASGSRFGAILPYLGHRCVASHRAVNATSGPLLQCGGLVLRSGGPCTETQK